MTSPRSCPGKVGWWSLAWLAVGCLWACTDSRPARKSRSRPGGSPRALAPTGRPSPAPGARLDATTKISRSSLRQDLRQLKRLLEETHPDPYSHGGGPIAFNRRFRAIWDGIPAAGLTRRAFLRRVRPLVASLRDGHTRIGLGKPRGKRRRLLGVEFGICDLRLFVRRVYREVQRELLGSELVALEGISFRDLFRRMKQLRGYDNEVNNLVHLTDALERPALLAELLGQQRLPPRIRVRLRTPRGSLRDLTVPVTRSPARRPALAARSRLPLPKANAAGIGWGFLESDSKVAYLRVDSMVRYREAFESWRASGWSPGFERLLDAVLAKGAGSPPPADLSARIKAVPAATDSFRALTQAMRRRSTQSLVVDVRRNQGGNSLLGLILVHFLYGLDALDDLEGYQIPRYSELYFQQNHGVSRKKKLGHLRVGDYDFSQEEAWRRRRRSGPTAASRRKARQDTQKLVSMMPTFARELRAHRGAPLRPARVVVVTSGFTYSAGYDLAVILYKLGAKVAGSPSGQAGNCFIDALAYRLKHSRLAGTISYKRSLEFPDNPSLGELLSPTVPLTCRRLRELRFDPNAGVLLALDYLKSRPRGRPAIDPAHARE